MRQQRRYSNGALASSANDIVAAQRRNETHSLSLMSPLRVNSGTGLCVRDPLELRLFDRSQCRAPRSTACTLWCGGRFSLHSSPTQKQKTHHGDSALNLTPSRVIECTVTVILRMQPRWSPRGHEKSPSPLGRKLGLLSVQLLSRRA